MITNLGSKGDYPEQDGRAGIDLVAIRRQIAHHNVAAHRQAQPSAIGLFSTPISAMKAPARKKSIAEMKAARSRSGGPTGVSTPRGAATVIAWPQVGQKCATSPCGSSAPQ